jgi:cobalt-precorrin 5A hydrolase
MIKVFALTDVGKRLGDRLRDGLIETGVQVELALNPKPFAQVVQHAFEQGHSIIFIGATGIAVRVLAPVLKNKQVDPAVLVLDEAGNFVIPLLSGHEGGANALADAVATLINAQLVQTTAKPYIDPVYTIGMGCERNCPEHYLRELLQLCLDQAALSLSHITSINSIDIKADELSLIRLAESLKLPFRTWDVESLASVESQLSQRSDYVYKTVGVYGVAESAALFSAQQLTSYSAELVVNKIKNAKATCAIARSYPATLSRKVASLKSNRRTVE